MLRPIFAASLITSASVASAATINFDLNCSLSGVSTHADLNGESIAFDLTTCVGLSTSGITRLVFTIGTIGDAAKQASGSRQLDLISKYAFTSQIQSGKVHIKFDTGNAIIDGSSVEIPLPVYANGLDLIPST